MAVDKEIFPWCCNMGKSCTYAASFFTVDWALPWSLEQLEGCLSNIQKKPSQFTRPLFKPLILNDVLRFIYKTLLFSNKNLVYCQSFTSHWYHVNSIVSLGMRAFKNKMSKIWLLPLHNLCLNLCFMILKTKKLISLQFFRVLRHCCTSQE